MIVYFTGTGNSRYCAQMVADKLEDELTNSFRLIRDGIPAELMSDRPWVFVSPTYAWRMPRIFTDFILSGNFSGSKDAYFIMTCGGGLGNAAEKNEMLCRRKGWTCRGTLQVVMPENYIALYSAPEPVEAQKIVDAARPALEGGIACIRSDRNFPELQVRMGDRLKSGLINAFFYRFIVRAKPFTASDACISCGKCAQKCVLSNIELRNGKPVWGTRCTHCMACICGCPVGAIEYGRASAGKPRYRCPEYKGTR